MSLSVASGTRMKGIADDPLQAQIIRAASSNVSGLCCISIHMKSYPEFAMAQYILGSGEKTVAPTSGLPSFSFCFAVLYSGADVFCCVICAFPIAIQKNAREITMIGMIRLALNGSEERRVGKECRSRW